MDKQSLEKAESLIRKPIVKPVALIDTSGSMLPPGMTAAMNRAMQEISNAIVLQMDEFMDGCLLHLLPQPIHTVVVLLASPDEGSKEERDEQKLFVSRFLESLGVRLHETVSPADQPDCFRQVTFYCGERKIGFLTFVRPAIRGNIKAERAFNQAYDPNNPLFPATDSRLRDFLRDTILRDYVSASARAAYEELYGADQLQLVLNERAHRHSPRGAD